MATNPIILHVRTPSSLNFHHWVLFLGFAEHDRVTIYDPPRHRSEISVAELLAVWDGYGIVVTKENETKPIPIPYDWIFVTAIVGMTYGLMRRRWSPIGAIAVCGLVGGLAWGLLPQGTIGKPHATGMITSQYFPRALRELTYEEFRADRTAERSICVDARPNESFAALTVPGSVNIPVNASLLQLHDLTSNYPRERPMIVFCMSKSCGWADAVANQLVHLGFREVAIYRGGVADWIAHKQPVEK
jgi:rhodanese-related sulfurtransferase